MDEFYNARDDETPVTLEFPIGGTNMKGEFEEHQQIRRHYYGTGLSIEEVQKVLLEEGFVDTSDEPEDTPKLNSETMDPLNPGVHEFRVVKDECWGFSSWENKPRTHIRIKLYFNDVDFDMGLDYEDCIITKLNLECGD
jgi:hypothetical protein